jgi:ATP-dependent RNA helicase DeaD
VGALTHEGGLTGADVGRIDITPRFTVAEVPADALDMLFANMARATIRGQRAQMKVAKDWQFRNAPLPAR